MSDKTNQKEIKLTHENKHRKCILVKKFSDFPDKVIYQGTLRKAKTMIPPSKKDQYEIKFVGK